MPDWTFDIKNDLTYERACNEMRILANKYGRDKKHPHEMIILENGENKICIYYPGKKKPGDYILKRNEASMTHADMCEELAELIENGTFKHNKMKSILEDSFRRGYRAVSEPKERELRALLFWLTLQERINYPRGENILMPYKRYAEAIDTTLPNSRRTIGDVLYDADSANSRPNISYKLIDPPYYYCYQ